jgi:lipopolysaccharide biosynthesis regulator YciM
MHLALGNLFRRRGEVDRAIRIHHYLVERTNLSREQRSLAVLELAQDYMRAGLLDRAECLFLELVELGEHRAAGLRHLLDIYQQEKDWEKAITIATELEAVSGTSMAVVVGQLYCELAEAALHRGRAEEAEALAAQALATDERSARANLLRARLEAQRQDWHAAIRALERVEQQDPDYLPEVLEPLSECYQALGARTELIAYLRRCLARHGSVSVMLSLADLLRQEKGDQEAAEFVTDQLRQRASVRGLARFIELNLDHTEGRARDNLMILSDLTKKLLENKPVYRCRACGFSGKSLHWQCPGCKRWNTVKPIHGVEGK